MARFTHSPLLGTVVEVRVTGLDEALAAVADRAAVAEVERLEDVFSAFRPDSELHRWARGETGAGDDLTAVLRRVHEWQVRSGGALNPCTGVIAALWRTAESDGRPPDAGALADAAAAIAEPRIALVDGRPVPAGDCSVLDLNAVAKGHIVDRALAAARREVPIEATVVVSAGGDLAHAGPGAEVVAVEDPHRPYDNAAPLTTVAVSGAGMATSGSARRGFRVGGRWHAHVIDPRTGRTVDDVASVSVLAPDAATADLAATVLGVDGPDDLPSRADALGVGALVVAADGRRAANDRWAAAEEAARLNGGSPP